MRNITGCSVETFKGSLDGFLSGLRDEPLLHGYTQSRRCKTNLVDMCSQETQSLKVQLSMMGTFVHDHQVSLTQSLEEYNCFALCQKFKVLFRFPGDCQPITV